MLEKNNFSFELEAFDHLIHESTRMIILNLPSNLTVSVIPPGDLEHIAALAKQFDCWIPSDEIYARILSTIIRISKGMQARTIIMNGFYKTYSMTGWQLGFGIMPHEIAYVRLSLTGIDFTSPGRSYAYQGINRCQPTFP